MQSKCEVMTGWPGGLESRTLQAGSPRNVCMHIVSLYLSLHVCYRYRCRLWQSRRRQTLLFSVKDMKIICSFSHQLSSWFKLFLIAYYIPSLLTATVHMHSCHQVSDKFQTFWSEKSFTQDGGSWIWKRRTQRYCWTPTQETFLPTTCRRAGCKQGK